MSMTMEELKARALEGKKREDAAREGRAQVRSSDVAMPVDVSKMTITLKSVEAIFKYDEKTKRRTDEFQTNAAGEQALQETFELVFPSRKTVEHRQTVYVSDPRDWERLMGLEGSQVRPSAAWLGIDNESRANTRFGDDSARVKVTYSLFLELDGAAQGTAGSTQVKKE